MIGALKHRKVLVSPTEMHIEKQKQTLSLLRGIKGAKLWCCGETEAEELFIGPLRFTHGWG